LAASIVQESGKVISFEPNLQNLQLLFSSIVENQFLNIEVYPLAASDSSMILKLTSFGSNGYLETALAGESNVQFVQSVAVDELLQTERQINVIKMDIEGYETLALRGMNKLITKHRPIIFTEFSPWHIKTGAKSSPGII
jgi:FkbM family methyltransferase